MSAQYKETYVFYSHSIPMHGHTYKTKGLGGSESSLVYMARALARLGKKVIVFCKTNEPAVYDGVTYERLEKFASFAQFNIMDVFISVRSPAVFYNTIKAHRKLLWVHDAPDQPHLACLKQGKIKDAIDYYITISAWQTAELMERFNIPEEKIFASRNGVVRNYYHTYRSKRKKRLVYTSTPFRGLEILLELFPHIRKRVPDVELFIYSSMSVYGVSREDDNERFGNIYAACKQPGVKLVGSLPQQELARELRKARLFVYPNVFSETSCIAALEAQAAGLPAVAARRGALSETIAEGETGLLVDGSLADNTVRKEFIETVIGLLENDDRWSAMSRKAHERIMGHYCWQTIAEEWVGFFDSLRPRLSVCMIARNEEDYLATAIQSVRSIVDEIIVVDTGSQDNTKKIAASLGAQVYDFSWCDDFSKARNFASSKATADWILVLDADESIAAEDITKVRQLINVPDAYAYLFFQRSYLNDTTVVGWKSNKGEYAEGTGYGGYFDSPLTRLFRNHEGFAFEGKVHELIEYSILRKKRQIINTDIPIHHYGKVRGEDVAQRKGDLYLEIGRTKTKENPYDPRAFYELGAQYFELDRIDEAKNCYEEAVSLDPKHYRALCELGIIYARQSEYDQAIALLQEAIEINPQYASSYVNLGIVYESIGRMDEAVEMLNKALALDASHANAYRNLGLIYFAQERFRESLECFRKMRKLDSSINVNLEFATASYTVGTQHMDNKEYARAKRYFEEAVKIMPSFAAAYNNLGIVYVNMGDLTKAEDQFTKALGLTETNPKARQEYAKASVNLGFVYNNKGEFQKALVILEKALELDPTNPELYNHIGIAKCALGQLHEGISFFETTLRLKPDHSAAKVNRFRVKELLIHDRNREARVKQ